MLGQCKMTFQCLGKTNGNKFAGFWIPFINKHDCSCFYCKFCSYLLAVWKFVCLNVLSFLVLGQCILMLFISSYVPLCQQAWVPFFDYPQKVESLVGKQIETSFHSSTEVTMSIIVRVVPVNVVLCWCFCMNGFTFLHQCRYHD